VNRLQAFAAELFEREGALVDVIEPEGLEVLAPPHLQQACGIPDLCRFGFGATLPTGARRAGIEADWLARFADVLAERGRYSRRVLCPANPPLADAERVLEHQVALANATYRLRGVSEAWTRYLILDFRYTAFSDEKREGLVQLGVNLATGAMLDGIIERLLPRLDAEAEDAEPPEGVALPPPWPQQRVLDLLGRGLHWRVASQVEAFAGSLRRRLGRDEARLYDYHNGLFQDAGRRIAALPEGEEKRRRGQHRAEAIEREYHARLDDLRHKYALRVTVQWTQTLEILMPVQRLELLVRRRKGERVMQLDWNPLARRLEPLPCDFSHAAEGVRLVCDDALHLVRPAGLAACAGCGKPYCRACHRQRCPKCGHAETSAMLTSAP
jgi:hypothetical protein